MVRKTRHKEYSDAIRYTKERVDVDSDYSTFMINRCLMKTPEDVLLLNALNHKMVPFRHFDRGEQSLHEKQMHFDFLLHSIKKKNPPIRKEKEPTKTLDRPSVETEGDNCPEYDPDLFRLCDTSLEDI